MSNSSTIQERNRQLADAINQEALTNPDFPSAGKFVGIANGKVVAVTDDLDELVRRPDHEKTFIIEAGIDYDQVQEIWRLR